MFPINKFSSVNTELVSDSRAPKERLKRYKSEGPKTPYYRFTLTTPPLPLREGMALAAVLDSYHGNINNFDLSNPIPQQKAQTGLYLYQAANKGAGTVVLAGAQPNEVDAVIAGDFIQINGSRKAYRILADSNANSSGHVEVKLTQALIQNYLAPSVVKYGANVVFQVCMEDRDSADITAKDSKFISHDVELIEQI